MTIFQAMQERRSIRKFQDRPVPRDLIEQVIRAGLLAPSAKNRQPWRFVVAQEAAKDALLSAMAQGLAREQKTPLLPGSASMLQGAVRTMRIMAQAPVVILVLQDKGRSLREAIHGEARVYERCDMQSIGACMEHMSLIATALGLGSLWIGDIYFAYEALTAWLHADGELVAALALGYAEEHPPARPRKALESLVEWRA